MIFINYRRDDSMGMAGRLYDRLAQAFGQKNLFMDVDHIPAGVDFVNYLNNQLAACEFFIAVIGPKWLDARNELGDRRLHVADDFVTIEIAAALARDIRVIPVLIDGARMPKADDLPELLRPLVRRHAVNLRHDQFGRDAEALIEKIREASHGRPAKSTRWRAAAGIVAVLLLLAGIGFFVTRMPLLLSWTVQPREQPEKERLAAAQVDAGPAPAPTPVELPCGQKPLDDAARTLLTFLCPTNTGIRVANRVELEKLRPDLKGKILTILVEDTPAQRQSRADLKMRFDAAGLGR